MRRVTYRSRGNQTRARIDPRLSQVAYRFMYSFTVYFIIQYCMLSFFTCGWSICSYTTWVGHWSAYNMHPCCRIAYHCSFIFFTIVHLFHLLVGVNPCRQRAGSTDTGHVTPHYHMILTPVLFSCSNLSAPSAKQRWQQEIFLKIEMAPTGFDTVPVLSPFMMKL